MASRTVRREARQSGTDYEADTHAWLERQVALLRAGRLSEIDVENVAEELEGMVKSQRHELRSRLEVLFAHLLKYEFQPMARSGSWRGTIVEQRLRIRDLLTDSPSLRTHLVHAFNDRRRYADAVRLAAADSGLPRAAFPESCPYSFEQVLDNDFWPGSGPHPDLGVRERRKPRT